MFRDTEPIAEAGDRLNIVGAVKELLPEGRDVFVYGAISNVGIFAPYRGHRLVATKESLMMPSPSGRVTTGYSTSNVTSNCAGRLAASK
jgi:hypothetical protein